jgi:hypothetical protein
MIGDLGKASALKQAEAWAVDAWTFMSNYPVSEKLGAEIVSLGRDAGIDVSWRGPEFFETALNKHPDLLKQFPHLQINVVSDQLARIAAAVHAHAPSSGRLVESVPRTPEEQEALLRQHPPGWEIRLFASVLLQRQEGLEPKWRDHELRLPGRSRRYVAEAEIADYLSRALRQLGAMIEPISRLFDDQQAAFGLPGEQGDPVRLEHFANWIMSTYEDILDWGVQLRATDSSDVMTTVIELTARLAEAPARQMRDFIEKVISGAERILDHLSKSKSEQEATPLVIEATLVVSLDMDAVNEATRALRVALGLPDVDED